MKLLIAALAVAVSSQAAGAKVLTLEQCLLHMQEARSTELKIQSAFLQHMQRSMRHVGRDAATDINDAAGIFFDLERTVQDGLDAYSAALAAACKERL